MAEPDLEVELTAVEKQVLAFFGFLADPDDAQIVNTMLDVDDAGFEAAAARLAELGFIAPDSAASIN